MRPLVLLLIVVPAILHAYPQRQLDRRRVDSVEETPPSRGSRKFSPPEDALSEEVDSWSPERTERRQPSRGRSSALRGVSNFVAEPSAVTSTRRQSSRRIDPYAFEPEIAYSLHSPVREQLITSRRAQQFQRRTAQESESTTEVLPRRSDSYPVRRDSAAFSNENTRFVSRRTRTSSPQPEVFPTESSRKSRNGRRNPVTSTEGSRRSARRNGSRRKQDTEVTTASSSVQSTSTEISSVSPTTESTVTVQTTFAIKADGVVPDEAFSPTAEASPQPELREVLSTDTSKLRNNKAEESSDSRRETLNVNAGNSYEVEEFPETSRDLLYRNGNNKVEEHPESRRREAPNRSGNSKEESSEIQKEVPNRNGNGRLQELPVSRRRGTLNNRNGNNKVEESPDSRRRDAFHRNGSGRTEESLDTRRHTGTSNRNGNKLEEAPDSRRDVLNRRSRKLDSSLLGSDNTRNNYSPPSDSVSSANTREFRKRPSNDFQRVPKVTNNIPSAHDNALPSPISILNGSPTDVLRRTALSRKTTTTEATPDDNSRTTSSGSENQKPEVTSAHRIDVTTRRHLHNGASQFRFKGTTELTPDESSRTTSSGFENQRTEDTGAHRNEVTTRRHLHNGASQFRFKGTTELTPDENSRTTSSGFENQRTEDAHRNDITTRRHLHNGSFNFRFKGTTELAPDDGSTSSSSENRRTDEPSTSRSESSTRGKIRSGSSQFRNRGAAEVQNNTAQQRGYRRNSARGGKRTESSADVVPQSSRELTSSRNKDASASGTQVSFQRDASSRGGRKSYFRGLESEQHKEITVLSTEQSHSHADAAVEQLQRHEMFKISRDPDEIQDQEAHAGTASDLEDSFITRSSHQVVTVTAYPYSQEQSVQSDGTTRGLSRSRTKVSETLVKSNKISNTVNVESKAVTRRAEITKDYSRVRPRTANLLLAPSPPSSAVENSVEEAQRSKVLVVGGYSRIQNAEGSTTPAFARLTSRKNPANTDENSVNRPSRGKPRDKAYQKETSTTSTTEARQQAPTSSSQFQSSNAGRSGPKHRFTPSVENVPSSTTLASTKRPRSPLQPTSRKPLDNLYTSTVDVSMMASSSQKVKTLKDSAAWSTSSFRRSVSPPTGDNRVLPTTSISVVTSKSVQANVPRFSSRYRSELLRATGHGIRGTTTPVYVPTVPTVRTTAATTTTTTGATSTEPPLFSAIGKMASFLSIMRSEARSHLVNQL